MAQIDGSGNQRGGLWLWKAARAQGGKGWYNEDRHTAAGQDGKFWSSGAGADRGKGSYNEGRPTAAGQNGRGNHWDKEGRPQLQARTAGTITGTTRAGTQVQVRTARPWGSIYIGDTKNAKM